MFYKEFELISKPLKIGCSSYFLIPKKVYKTKKGKYYRLKITISEV